MRIFTCIILYFFILKAAFSQTQLFFPEDQLPSLIKKEVNGHIIKELAINPFMASILLKKGVSHLNQRQIEDAFHSFKLAHDIALRINNEQLLAKSYNNIAFIFQKQIQFKKAIKWYNKAIPIFNKLEMEKEIAICYKNIAEINFSNGHFKEALRLYLITEIIQEKYNQSNELIHTYNNMGRVHFSLGQFKNAFNYYLKAKTITDKLNIKKEGAIIINNIGVGRSCDLSLKN